MFQNQDQELIQNTFLMPLTVSDIKQYVYCPRLIYYRYVLPVPYATTYKMAVGRETHSKLSALERRRTLRRYRLNSGKRMFHEKIFSERLQLSGKLDLLIEDEGRYFPVEFKESSGKPQLHQRYQLTAYGLLVEERYSTVVRYGYIYMIEDEKVSMLDINEGRKRYVKLLLARIRKIVQSETMPPPTPHRERCLECEFKLYCADTV